jgi:hypothetical protein
VPQSRLDRVVLTAMSRDASLEESVAREFAASALESVAAGVDPDDAPELARRLLGAHSDLGASTATVVAAAVSDVLMQEQPAG